ncbi:MAG: HAD family phosphatase [Candidatus Aenigmarchaeota archaeon]|nr:HAD family phosphatase [Candidatus Aenigmarchaeota archaeon]
MTRAILYDVDGLMVDSETLGMRVAKEVLGKYGREPSQEELERFIGVTDEKFYRDFFRSRAIAEKALQDHFEIYERELPDVPVFPGVAESVRRFKPRYKLGVVSGSTLHQVNIILQRAGVEGCFDAKVTCEMYDTENSKPHPEPYLIAAWALDLRPEQCVALEDATPGILSAKKAGMKVVGVKIGNKGRQDLSKADVAVETLDEVTLELVRSL